MRQPRLIRRCAIALALLWCATPPAPAQTTVDVQIVLAVDASGSVSDSRFELQKQGYVAAFRHPRLLSAILQGGHQSIAVTMMQWTGPHLQVHAVPWTILKDNATVHAFAGAIEKAPRDLFSGGTSISGAIDRAMTLLLASPFRGLKRVIDISGDGANNRGRPVTQARDEAVRAGVVINGLPILELEPWLDKYYFDNVIGGPGSFMIPAETYDKFADAVLRKLVLEIASTGAAPRALAGVSRVAKPPAKTAP
jgi:hypothetical protein